MKKLDSDMLNSYEAGPKDKVRFIIKGKPYTVRAEGGKLEVHAERPMLIEPRVTNEIHITQKPWPLS